MNRTQVVHILQDTLSQIIWNTTFFDNVIQISPHTGIYTRELGKHNVIMSRKIVWQCRLNLVNSLKLLIQAKFNEMSDLVTFQYKY